MTVPDLDHYSGSWVCTAPKGAVVELYERSNVEYLAARGWTVETAYQYLCRINRAIKGAN